MLASRFANVTKPAVLPYHYFLICEKKSQLVLVDRLKFVKIILPKTNVYRGFSKNVYFNNNI
jgi:hypothetical protein